MSEPATPASSSAKSRVWAAVWALVLLGVVVVAMSRLSPGPTPPAGPQSPQEGPVIMPAPRPPEGPSVQRGQSGLVVEFK